jgi:alkaline phosphatase
MASSASATEATAKNVIILIPDGMSQSIQTLGRWYRGESLALDEMGAGTMAAWMVNSITTDSAPAGTAMATGYRTTDKFVSVGPIEATALSTYRLPEGIDWDWYSYRPLATVVEGAKHLGKATGLISTSRITHATPASFGAHVEARSMENDIAEQLVHQNLDVVFGGGWDRLLPAPEGSRTDGENLLQVLQDRGYQWVETKSQMDALTSGRTWGLFAKSAMMPDIDRQYLCNEAFDMQACSEPTLAEMTTKAIELLSQNDNGFVLMVEGSQIDWAGHANDPAYMLHDFLAFDDAARVALDFAKANPHDTLILAAPDHNTGGLALGNATVHWTYTDITVEDLLDPIKGMQTTAQLMARDLPPQPTPGDIQAVVQQYWGIELSVKDAEDIIAYETDPDVFGFGYAISKIVSERHTILSWASHGHTGEDLPFWSYG